MISIHPNKIQKRKSCRAMDFDRDLIDCQPETRNQGEILFEINLLMIKVV